MVSNFENLKKLGSDELQKTPKGPVGISEVLIYAAFANIQNFIPNRLRVVRDGSWLR